MENEFKTHLETGVVVNWNSASEMSARWRTSVSFGKLTILLFVSWIVSRIRSISSWSFCRLAWIEAIFSFFSAFSLFIWSLTNLRKSRTCFSVIIIFQLYLIVLCNNNIFSVILRQFKIQINRRLTLALLNLVNVQHRIRRQLNQLSLALDQLVNLLPQSPHLFPINHREGLQLVVLVCRWETSTL